MTTQERIDYCMDMMCRSNVNCQSSDRYPVHLRYEVFRIKQEYDKYKHVSMADEQFLLIFERSTKKWLLDHAYICGQWVEYKSHTHRNYNLKRKSGSKQVKQIKRPHYYSNL